MFRYLIQLFLVKGVNPLMNFSKWPCLIFLFILATPEKVAAQFATIQSDSIVCLGSGIQFNATVSGGNPNQFEWKFGDGSTANTAVVQHIYVKPGFYQVDLKVTLQNGTLLTDSKIIHAYSNPLAKISLDPASIFCLDQNNVCFIDSSQTNQEGIKLTKRILLWGDGAASKDTPYQNANLCHHYTATGAFKADFEVTDAKGCYAKTSSNVYIYPSIYAKIILDSIYATCDSVKIYFYPDTTLNAPTVKYHWFLNGNPIGMSSFPRDSILRKPGNYILTLLAENGPYCSDRDSIPFSIFFPPILPAVVTPIKICAKQNLFRITKPIGQLPGAVYYFSAIDFNKQSFFIRYYSGNGNTDSMYIDGCGPFLLYQTVSIGNCERDFKPDTFELLGPRLKLKVRNGQQCRPNDLPVLFCEDLCDHKMKRPYRWVDYGDGMGYTQVSSSRKFGNGCYEGKYIIGDSVTGCVDTAKFTISINPPDVQPNPSAGRKGIVLSPNTYAQCLGNICFDYNSILPAKPCAPKQIRFLSDSGAPWAQWEDVFSKKFKGSFDSANRSFCYPYEEVYDSLGRVTVGIAVQTGYDSVYFNCDSIVVGKNICVDTIWLHFRVSKPLPEFTLKQSDICPPAIITTTPQYPLQDSIIQSIWNFDYDTTIIYHLKPGDSIPTTKYTFKKSGAYIISHILINIHGCRSAAREYVNVGHFSDFTTDTVVCLGNPSEFSDSIYYYEQLRQAGLGLNIYPNWHPTNLKHKMYWDFGDGSIDSVFNPKHTYKKIGTYTVRLITIDSLGCIDTLVKPNYIHVIQLKAAFFPDKERYLCGEFARFIDSSWFQKDSLTTLNIPKLNLRYHWTWGDGKRYSDLQHPYHNFTTFGWVNVKQHVQNEMGCSDSLEKKIFIKGPVPSFKMISDSVGCVPLTVHLRNTSVDSTCSHYIWLMGDPAGTTISTDDDTDIVFTYNQPGIYEIYLIGQDSVYNPATGNRYYCYASYPDTFIPPGNRIRVIVQAYPPVAAICPDTICKGVPFTFTDSSSSIYTHYRTDFGDSTITNVTVRTQTHTYFQPGLFTIKHFPTYTPVFPLKLCADSLTKKIYVASVQAAFDTTQIAHDPEYIYAFTNHSTGAVAYNWWIRPVSGGRTAEYQTTDVQHNFGGDSGWHEVCLRALSKEGCVDTTCKMIYNPVIRKLIIPNVYTNDGDSINDAFDIEIIGEDGYELIIYNLWGERVFWGDADGIGNDGTNWNGHEFNTGKECPTGTYYYVFRCRFKGMDEWQHFKGTVTLLRKN